MRRIVHAASKASRYDKCRSRKIWAVNAFEHGVDLRLMDTISLKLGLLPGARQQVAINLEDFFERAAREHQGIGWAASPADHAGGVAKHGADTRAVEIVNMGHGSSKKQKC